MASVGWLHASAGAAGMLALTQPSDPFVGTLPPTATADTVGMYGQVINNWPLVSIHATLAQNGEIITYGTQGQVKVQGAMEFDHWDPGTDTHRQSGELAVDSFCNIVVPRTGGDLMMAGGNAQETSGIYDTNARTYSALPNFVSPRWYASMIRLPDERYVVIGGAEANPDAVVGRTPEYSPTPEVLAPGDPNWTPLTGADSNELFGGPNHAWYYPKAYLAPSGNVFGISQRNMWVLDPDGDGSVSKVGTVPGTGYGASASSVMFEPGKILLAGGGQQTNSDDVPASAGASVIDISTDDPVATSVGSMANPRNWLDLTVLPNGEVLASGGTGVGLQEATAVYGNEIWSPVTRTWRPAAAGIKIRTYHSTSLLMPSGAVFTGGGGVPGPVANLNTELFYPPYLFTRSGATVQWADRPEFRGAEGDISRGGWARFDMSDGRPIASVSLTSAGSVTHSYNADQRRIPLAFGQSGSAVTVAFPESPTALPSGIYLLHAVDANGVPAPSQIIEILPDGTPGPITVYGSGPQVPPLGTPPVTLPTTSTTTTTTPSPSTTTTTTTTPTTKPPTTVPPKSRPPVPPGDELFTGLTPSRLLDTREGVGALGADSSLSLSVLGVGGVPTSGVEAVALNVTVAETTAPSFLTVSPRGVSRPTVSNLNWDTGGVTKANAVVVKVGDGGLIDLYNLAGSAHVIVDVAGWFHEGGGFEAITPSRVLDSRSELGRTVSGPVGPGEEVVVSFGGAGVPVDAAGVVFNATATGGSAPSFVTAFPANRTRPDASNLNVFPGATTSNLVVSGLGAGASRLSNEFGAVHLLADAAGYFEAGSGYTAMNPSRLLDTRGDSKLGPGEVRSLRLAGVDGGVPASASVAIVNVTALLATAPSFMTVFPHGASQPNASNLNFAPGMVVPNLVFAAIGDDGSIDISNAHGEVDLLVDVLGYLD